MPMVSIDVHDDEQYLYLCDCYMPTGLSIWNALSPRYGVQSVDCPVEQLMAGTLSARARHHARLLAWSHRHGYLLAPSMPIETWTIGLPLEEGSPFEEVFCTEGEESNYRLILHRTVFGPEERKESKSIDLPTRSDLVKAGQFTHDSVANWVGDVWRSMYKDLYRDARRLDSPWRRKRLGAETTGSFRKLLEQWLVPSNLTSPMGPTLAHIEAYHPIWYAVASPA